MIKLENVSTLPLVGLGERPSKVSRQNKEMIEHFNLTDYKKLKRVYYAFKCYSDSIEEWESKITKTELEVEESNKKGLSPELFQIPTPEEYIIDFEPFSQDLIDKNAYAFDLLYGSPFEIGEPYKYITRRFKLMPYTVYEIKQMLTHCDAKGLNLLKKYLHIYKDEEVQRILNALCLYQEQLERQCIDWDYGTLNESELFYSNQMLKMESIKLQIKEIADYLVDKAGEFVWVDSYHTEKEKLQIYKAAYKKDNNDIIKQKRLIEMLSNYVTLEEAKEGLVRTKSLDRFIKR